MIKIIDGPPRLGDRHLPVFSQWAPNVEHEVDYPGLRNLTTDLAYIIGYEINDLHTTIHPEVPILICGTLVHEGGGAEHFEVEVDYIYYSAIDDAMFVFGKDYTVYELNIDGLDARSLRYWEELYKEFIGSDALDP